MTRTYAIGDIHGHLDELGRAHELVAADRARVGDEDAPIVHLGDLCDRGPRSREVIELLMAGRARGENWVVLKGNHDRLFAHYMRDPEERDPLRDDLYWLDPPLGGRETLASFGVNPQAADVHAQARALVPREVVDFIEGLPLSFERGPCFFCHAGIRPGVALTAQSPDDLVWIRGVFLDSQADHGKLIVHGHTAIQRATHYGNRVNIDSGAGFGRPISAVVIEGREVQLLTETGRTPLPRE